MKTAQDIILAPVITENSMQGIGMKKYTFKVAPNAGKVEIASAVEKIFGVKVAKVNTISVRGRYRRQGQEQKGHRYSHAGFQDHRVLRVDGIRERPRRGAGYGDMTPIIIHKTTKENPKWRLKSINRRPRAAAA